MSRAVRASTDPLPRRGFMRVGLYFVVGNRAKLQLGICSSNGPMPIRELFWPETPALQPCARALVASSSITERGFQEVAITLYNYDITP